MSFTLGGIPFPVKHINLITPRSISLFREKTGSFRIVFLPQLKSRPRPQRGLGPKPIFQIRPSPSPSRGRGRNPDGGSNYSSACVIIALLAR